MTAGPVFLVGFMGAGKTTAGKALARLLRWEFVDLDERIEEIEGRRIARIFADDGERYFRRRETEVVSSLRGYERLVVACGGGTYAQDETRTLIDRIGRAVWLQIPLPKALARCGSGQERPMLKDPAQVEALYRSRLPSYRAAALRVDTEGLTPEQIAERIAGIL